MSSAIYRDSLHWHAADRSPRGAAAGSPAGGDGAASGDPASAPSRPRGQQVERDGGTPLDMKMQYLAECNRALSRPTHAGHIGDPAPAANRRRAALIHFGGFGVLCAIGAIMAVQTGPFPLNVVVGAAIAALFGADTFKKIRLWRKKHCP